MGIQSNTDFLVPFVKVRHVFTVKAQSPSPRDAGSAPPSRVLKDKQSCRQRDRGLVALGTVQKENLDACGNTVGGWELSVIKVSWGPLGLVMLACRGLLYPILPIPRRQSATLVCAFLRIRGLRDC